MKSDDRKGHAEEALGGLAEMLSDLPSEVAEIARRRAGVDLDKLNLGWLQAQEFSSSKG